MTFRLRWTVFFIPFSELRTDHYALALAQRAWVSWYSNPQSRRSSRRDHSLVSAATCPSNIQVWLCSTLMVELRSPVPTSVILLGSNTIEWPECLALISFSPKTLTKRGNTSVGRQRSDIPHYRRFSEPVRSRPTAAAWYGSDGASASERSTKRRGSGQSKESAAAISWPDVSGIPRIALGALPGAKLLRHRTADSRSRRVGARRLR